MRISVIPAFGILLALLVASPPQAVSQDSNTAPNLRVRVTYSGSGTVDENHKIYVVLWDSPAFAEGQGMPVKLTPLASKKGTVTFSDVKAGTAYVSAAFDPNGAWDGQSGPPPEGSSLGLYSKTPGKPEPIEITSGKTATIELSFDDTVKMRSGKATR